MEWKCVVPGKSSTAWEEGFYPVTLKFPAAYPMQPPDAYFPAGFFHPNVYPSGKVCLSLLSNDSEMGGTWAPSVSINQLLQSLQLLLIEPNIKSPAQETAFKVYQASKAEYET